jgi:hypothetical protein
MHERVVKKFLRQLIPLKVAARAKDQSVQSGPLIDPLAACRRWRVIFDKKGRLISTSHRELAK